MEAPVAVDADQHSITVAWKAFEGAVAYELQLQKTTTTGEEGSAPASEEGAGGGGQAAAAHEKGEGGGEWSSLSSTLKQTVVKKKNLSPGTSYGFRVRARDKIDWQPFSPPAQLQTLAEGSKQCSAPKLTSRGADWLAVGWEAVAGAERYTLEMRMDGELSWQVLATVTGTAAKKKHLTVGSGYYFRVRPEGGGEEWSFSPSSDVMHTVTMAPSVRAMLGASLLCKADGTTVATEELAGKVIGVYASAHWCGPCRQFTPLLAQFYNRVKAQGRPFEVVFASADHDEKSMMSYYGEMMPWLAMPYDGSEREDLMAKFQVRSIPRLIIFSAHGRVLESNAVGQQYLTDQALATWERGTAVSAAAPAQHCGSSGGGGCCGGGKCG